MPNWVSNFVSVSGTEADVQAFIEKAGRHYPSKSSSWNADTKSWEQHDFVNTDPFSFWNFIEPEDKVAYFGESEKPEGYKDWSMDEKLAHDLKFTGNGWYDWNVREWGTKWDASDVDFDEIYPDGKGNASVSVRFNTAWGIPTPVFEAMVKQHPTLDFDFDCEEEQGWGASFTSSDGDEDGERSLIETASWDIPDCHSDYRERGREDSCVCGWDEDEENWYSDCPRDDKDFYVTVTKTYRVSTNSAENAWELAQDNDPDEQMELVEDNTVIFVSNENGERLFPTLEDGKPKVKECSHHFVPVYKAVDGGKEFLGKQDCVFCHTELPLDKDPELG